MKCSFGDCGGTLLPADDVPNCDLKCDKCDTYTSTQTECLGLCGCGTDDVEKWAVCVLEALAKPMEDGHRDAVKDAILSDQDSVYEFVLHMFDKLRLTEHGGNVFGSWIDLKGEEALGLLKAKKHDD